MQLISCHDGRLLTLDTARAGAGAARSFRTGLEALDALAPAGEFARGAVHELLSEKSRPLFVATLLAKGILSVREAARGAIIWCDPAGGVYPPALNAHGIPLEQLFLLHPSETEQTWAVAECLRCKGVSAVIAAVPPLSRIEARRLQLAAEQGGGTGILLRTTGRGADIYSAATRWLIRPAPGERTVQRWTIQLLHGHGGRIGQAVTLELHRENHLVLRI